MGFLAVGVVLLNVRCGTARALTIDELLAVFADPRDADGFAAFLAGDGWERTRRHFLIFLGFVVADLFLGSHGTRSTCTTREGR